MSTPSGGTGGPRPLRVYVAGPLSGPDRAENVRRAAAAGREVMLLGHHPFVPHLFDLVDPRDELGYERWMALDLDWLSRCDALVRLPGASPGADREVAAAGRLGIPVLDGVAALAAADPALLGPREVRVEIDESVASLDTGEVELRFTHEVDGDAVACRLARSEARELAGQILTALEGRDAA